MKKSILIIAIIEKILTLLTSVQEDNWAKSFMKFREQFDSIDEVKLADARTDILKIYGGMGSFNDLVLYDQGQPMIEENTTLDALRRELFTILSER